MMSTNDGDDLIGNPTKAHKGAIEESNNSWDESMLTAAFDRQIKLVQKSLQEPPPPPPPAPPASARSNRSSLKSKTKDNKREVKSEVKPDKDLITHSSRRFRFQEEAVPAESSVPDSVVVASTKKGTSKSVEQTNTQLTASNVVPCMMPPPFDTSKFPEIKGEDEARASMLMSWYMAGYHTGYFEATRKFKKPS